MSTILITGANRGIGLALTRQYAAEGADVFACCRDPAKANDLNELATSSSGRVRITSLDVADESSIASLKRTLGEQPVDILINNAGISCLSADRIEAEGFITTMRINALAPMLIAQTLYDNLRGSTQKKLVAITSIMGSTSSAGGGKYAYRASKAALNNGMRGLSRAWARDGILVALLNPGYVQTEMVKGQVAFISAEECARGLIARITELTPANTGVFQDYRGVRIRW
ncbi:MULTISPECIES: SDR family oxidoreductase [unclassified Bradyrhizobium]|uniref:SDR family oxidoreductase n=1 Tax=unclassified Bradyrhizobium TaxID=2631580 RepID=UPI001FFAE704|nr:MULTISPECIES: SDR family oxidoreductase [unclassified Bradyrhizobium]MCK1349239.1 SDR family oxidoreductase [Bradyrhizobium sp. CW11]MCK1700983.1 SDR family oxidoreductase [Bradyrhizobium sp. 146]